MRILLDESLPRRLRQIFPEHEVVTVAAVLVARDNQLESLRVPVTNFLLKLRHLPVRVLLRCGD